MKWIRLLLSLHLILAKIALAQNPSLVKNLNTDPVPESISQMAVIESNGKIYFTTLVNSTGLYSLWLTDGITTTLLHQGFSLLYFINSFQKQYTELNGNLFFLATTAETGQELWMSDGTPGGTHIVKDILPGPQSGLSSPFLVSALGSVFFTSPSANGNILWKTDGTEVGTVMVKNFTAGAVTFHETFEYNGKLYLDGENHDNGYELWISDGTESGTFLLKDIFPGFKSAHPHDFTVLNNTIYFSATSSSGQGLWKTNGTNASTILVKDFDASSADAWTNLTYMTAFNGKLVFSAFTYSNGIELWTSDGTSGGTNMLVDIYPGQASSIPLYYIPINGKLMFTAVDPAHGLEMWTTDGTSVGTQLLKDINPGPGSSYPLATIHDLQISCAVVDNGKGYFWANDGVHGTEPWITNGTEGGTLLLKDTKAGSSGASEASWFYKFGNAGLLGFIPAENGEDNNLWISDGTGSGTTQLSAPDSSFPDYKTILAGSNKLYFTGNLGDFLPSNPLWETDGTEEGTNQIVLSVSEDESSYPGEMIKISENKYVFAAKENAGSMALYITDGTGGGTSVVRKFLYADYPNPIFSFSQAVANGKAFFIISYSGGTQIWATDGTSKGTILLPVSYTSFENGSIALNDIFYFTAGPNIVNAQLYRSDGTVAGTYALTSFPGNGGYIGSVTSLGNDLLFFPEQVSNHTQIWKSDGTVDGTNLVYDFGIYFDVQSENQAVFNGKLYFVGDDITHGKELWSTDGISSVLVKDVEPGAFNSSISNFRVSGNLLFFSAVTEAGNELWKTDGTATGTVLVKDINPGIAHANPSNLINLNGELYFSAGDSEGYALWKSDGTDSGTIKIHDFDGGLSGTQVESISVSSGNLYILVLKDPEYSLWRSDGTSCRTQQLELDSLQLSSYFPLLFSGDHLLFFDGQRNNSGYELYKYITSPLVTYEVCNGFDDDCDNLIDENAVASINPSSVISICKHQPFTFNTDDGIGLIYQWNKGGTPIEGATEIDFTTGKNESGNFSVTVTSAQCMATSAVTQLNRYDLPAASVTPLGNLDICSSGSVDLQANSGNSYTYQWIKNKNEIESATDILYTANKKGNYQVIVTNTNGCSQTSDKVNVINSCKDENTTSGNPDELLVYPNPSSGSFSIQLTCPAKNGVLKLFEETGRMVYSLNIASFTTSLPIQLPAYVTNGVYILMLESDDRIFYHKLMIQQ